MFDKFDRQINYLRVSVTDRCNLRCKYCMPEEGVPMLSHNDILRFEEILEVIETAVTAGISKVRITGGEPLIRKGITSLVGSIAAVPGIHDLSLTTNGTLLSDFAEPLAEAGLQRINISLDTMDPDKYAEITRGGDLKRVIQGIIAAKKAGIHPIKINCVVEKNSDEPDATGVRAFGEKNGLQVRYIRRMSLAGGDFSIVEGGSGGDCSHCNRLRLTSNGKIKPCLFNELEYDVRELGAAEAIRQAIMHKPACGTHNYSGSFNKIGG